VASSTLTGHLKRLEDGELIEAVERDREGLDRGQPYRFFQIDRRGTGAVRPERPPRA
jgi:DNA-binding transcriptional ArsR family regulator